MKPKIIVLVGHIASGKSSYCKNAAKAGYIIINDDSIVEMLHGGNYNLYDKSLKILYKSLENQIAASALQIGRSVVIDRGLNVSIKGRERWIALAKSFDVPYQVIVFPKDKPEVHAKRRFEFDSRGHPYEYWLKVATHHDKIYSLDSELEDLIKHISYEDILNGVVI